MYTKTLLVVSGKSKHLFSGSNSHQRVGSTVWEKWVRKQDLLDVTSETSSAFAPWPIPPFHIESLKILKNSRSAERVVPPGEGVVHNLLFDWMGGGFKQLI